jgi:CRISPR-associated Csx10 family RAMP protein
MKLRVLVSNYTPLCFRKSRSDKSVETLKYIPGSSFLGGLAASHCWLNCDKKDEFSQFFTSRKIRFSNLYPANFESDELKGDDLPVIPVPSTAFSCKRFSGFQFNADAEDEERHGVSDYLIPWALFAISKKISILESVDKCKFTENGYTCGEPLDSISSEQNFYRKVDDWQAIGISKIGTHIITRSGVSRKRGTVVEEILYNRETLLENQTFWGTITLEDEFCERLKSFISTASESKLTRLGNNRSRGLGGINVVTVEELASPESTESLKERVESFTDKMRQMAESFNITLPHYSLYIPITLQSDLILKDELLRYMTALEPGYFEKVWRLNGIELVYQSSSIRRINSWNSLLKMPKADDIAITMGSVFLLGYNSTIDDALWQALIDIQNNGIGERRHEGFGEISIADSFHLEVRNL